MVHFESLGHRERIKEFNAALRSFRSVSDVLELNELVHSEPNISTNRHDSPPSPSPFTSHVPPPAPSPLRPPTRQTALLISPRSSRWWAANIYIHHMRARLCACPCACGLRACASACAAAEHVCSLAAASPSCRQLTAWRLVTTPCRCWRACST